MFSEKQIIHKGPLVRVCFTLCSSFKFVFVFFFSFSSRGYGIKWTLQTEWNFIHFRVLHALQGEQISLSRQT